VVRTRAIAEGRGRPAWLYNAAPEVGSDHGAREYAALASALAAQIGKSSPDPATDPIEAGRMWGQELVRESQAEEDLASVPAAATSAIAVRRKVVALIDGLGFAPTADARVSVVKLRRCPLLEAAHRNPQVVCAVHLGFVRGALDELGADPTRTEKTALQPFSEPGACRLDLLLQSSTAR
jgi:predicted ArsR family transcriptional regulator